MLDYRNMPLDQHLIDTIITKTWIRFLKGVDIFLIQTSEWEYQEHKSQTIFKKL